ncbi:MAG TPA: ABC transporter permease [Vicinamibacterales bacterium]
MRDFAAHVRAHLPRASVPDERYEKVVEELADELESLYAASMERGATDAEAWHAVLAQVPSWPALAEGLTATTPVPREARRRFIRLQPLRVERWIQDITLGHRTLRKDWGYTTTAVVTLAICLAGNAAILPSVNGILLHPLQVPEPERVVLMANQYPLVEKRVGIVSAPPDYEDRLRSVTALEEQAMYNYAVETIESGGLPARTLGLIATPSLHRVLRVTPALGRAFVDNEATPGNDRRVILSDGLWREISGGDPAIVGKTIRLTGRDFTVVGVFPPAFSFAGAEIRFWIPLALDARQRSDERRHANGWFSVGRMRPGTSIAQVQEQLKALDAANLNRFPQMKPLLVSTGFYTSVAPLGDMLIRNVKTPLTLVWGAALAVLFVGVINLGHLALARSRIRLHELGTRLAIGARTSDLVRQLLVEGWIIAAAGTGLALIAGRWLARLVSTARPAGLSVPSAATLDGDAIRIVVVLGISVGALIGIISALPLFTTRLGAMLKEATRSELRGRTSRTARRTLIVAQMACSFVLLVGAAVLWASVRTLLASDLGVRIESVITGSISLPRQLYASDDDARAFVNRSLEAIRRLPGVDAAGASTIMPMSNNFSSGPINAEGYIPTRGEPPVGSLRAIVTPGYFEAAGTRLVRGRFFDERDNDAGTRTIVIDEQLARRFWGNADPIGRRVYRPENPSEMLAPGPATRWLTVIGVAAHARLRGPEADDDVPPSYVPYAMNAPRDLGFLVRTSIDPATIAAQMRSAIASIDREIPLFDIRTLTERTDLAIATRRTTMQLATVFALVAVMLSAVGLYGVLTYVVTRRTHEIGVRLAVGSTPRGIVRLIVREGLALAVGGVVVGAIAMLSLRRLLASYVNGVSAADPQIMTIVAIGLAAIALVACVYPARRATRVDAIQVLRN